MEKYRKIAYFGASALVVLLSLYIFLRYALKILLPFLVSFSIAFISRPLIDRICKHTRLKRSAVSVVVMFLLLFVIAYFIFLSFSAAITQLGNLIFDLTEQLSGENNYITDFIGFLESLRLKFPFLDTSIIDDGSSVYSMATEMVSEALKAAGVKITSYLAGVIAALPSAFITGGVIILSLFYFSKDYDSISVYVKSLFPQSAREKMSGIKNNILSVVLKYFKSYFILLLLTFSELFVGFLFLKIENAFVLAAIIAVVDILPVLGVGIVLLPWALIAFVGGNTPLFMGLLILYAAVYFLRQIEEPRIVGKQMNVHPLFALFTMYAGLKIAGVGGMILGPFLAFVIKTVYDSFKNKKDIENEKNL